MRFSLARLPFIVLIGCSSTASSADGGPDSSSALDAGEASAADAPASTTTKETCTAWLKDNPSPSGLAPLTGNGASQRTNMLADGSKIVTIDDRYYTVSIPEKFYTASPRVVVASLHGTGGYPEADWNDWHTAMGDKGYAFVSLKWEGGTQSSTSDATVYTQLKQIDDDLKKVCPTSDARKWLLGFSVGSALSFAVIVRDAADRSLFLGNIANSGSAWIPMTTGKEVMHPSVEAAKSNASAFKDKKSWMYCGEMDTDHGWTMCEENAYAVTFVNTHGGTSTLFKDSTGKHGGLPKNPTARDAVLSFIAN